MASAQNTGPCATGNFVVGFCYFFLHALITDRESELSPKWMYMRVLLNICLIFSTLIMLWQIGNDTIVHNVGQVKLNDITSDKSINVMMTQMHMNQAWAGMSHLSLHKITYQAMHFLMLVPLKLKIWWHTYKCIVQGMVSSSTCIINLRWAVILPQLQVCSSNFWI